MKNIFKNISTSQLISFGAILIAGIAGAYGEIQKQKEQAEFEDYKNRVEALEEQLKEN